MARGPAVRYHASQMSRFALFSVSLAAVTLSSLACKKDEGTKVASAGAPADPSRPAVAPTRSATLPDLRPPPSTVKTDDLPPEMNPPGVPKISGVVQVDRDVRFIDEKVGTGPAPVKGKPIKVHYSGWLTDGTKFDASVDRGDPIEFPFDTGRVVKGWDIGLSSMKVGGKRRIILPAELAYGEAGAGDAIPPGAVLVFDVELIEASQ